MVLLRSYGRTNSTHNLARFKYTQFWHVTEAVFYPLSAARKASFTPLSNLSLSLVTLLSLLNWEMPDQPADTFLHMPCTRSPAALLCPWDSPAFPGIGLRE